MKLQHTSHKSLFAILAAFALAISTTSTTLAHVTVKPGEVTTATYQTFTVSVPNEKPVPTVSLKLLVPSEIASITPTQKAGWQISLEKVDDKITSVTWSGGQIDDGLRDEFTFSAKTPGLPTELQWKAYQTYSDGTVVAWDQEQSADSHGEEGSGPFSVTSVIQDTIIDRGEEIPSDDGTAADRALYVGIIGILLGLVALFFATRKK